MALQTYVAVKFLHKEDGDRYAFVPKSWVVAQREPDNTIVIAYPAEASLAVQHMKNNVEPAADWEEHLCELLYTTDNYGEVKIDIMLKNREVPKKKPKSEGVKAEKRAYVRRKSHITTPKKLVENSTPYEPPSHIVRSTINFNIPIGEFVCNFQVPSKLLQLAMGNPGYAGSPSLQQYESMYTKITETKDLKQGDYNDPDYRGWTLRHQNPGPGLTELYENTSVYVDSDKLNRYTRHATASSALIRTLLTLVFNDKALSTCTLSYGKNCLDAGAVQAMFKYVARVDSERKWGDVNEAHFKSCVRKKLIEMKRMSHSTPVKQA